MPSRRSSRSATIERRASFGSAGLTTWTGSGPTPEGSAPSCSPATSPSHPRLHVFLDTFQDYRVAFFRHPHRVDHHVHLQTVHVQGGHLRQILGVLTVAREVPASRGHRRLGAAARHPDEVRVLQRADATPDVDLRRRHPPATGAALPGRDRHPAAPEASRHADPLLRPQSSDVRGRDREDPDDVRSARRILADPRGRRTRRVVPTICWTPCARTDLPPSCSPASAHAANS